MVDRSLERRDATSPRPGLYDRLIDSLLHHQLASLDGQRLLAEIQSVDPIEIPERVGEVIGEWVNRSLAAHRLGGRADAASKLAKEVLDTILRLFPHPAHPGLHIEKDLLRLTAIEYQAPTGEPIRTRRPLTPLRDTVLMTNGRSQAAVGHEIAAEIESADRIDLVLAYICWSGIRHLLEALRRHVEAGKSLRVITTTYTGTTELRALEELSGIGGKIEISYETSSTRLHAKAWLFHRESGFSTVYIGSSNLTHSAQVTGQEWNVRASQRLNPELIEAFERAFSTYWEDPHFEDLDAERFSQANSAATRNDAILTPFPIEPYPFQRQILDRLQIERDRGRLNNLIVAATGTGKTVVAALDYRRLRGAEPRARLLFVAHRTEILEQSQAIFRHALNDGSFGQLWVGEHRPNQCEHIFASVQSLNASDVSNLVVSQRWNQKGKGGEVWFGRPGC